jgi:hypothetical protein
MRNRSRKQTILNARKKGEVWNRTSPSGILSWRGSSFTPERTPVIVGVDFAKIVPGLDEEANGCPFLLVNGYFDKGRQAGNEGAFFGQIAPGDNDCFDGLIHGSSAYRLDFRSTCFAHDTGDGAGN